ncbi:MAG: DUF2309 domain-containing protein [Pelomonas sp.]|nr:DUF2309 domain-containing protein [Roseateles sp.]
MPTLPNPQASPAASPTAGATLAAQIDRACQQACASIAPAWPLDQAIAVNPHWSRIGMPLRQVAARLAVLAGIQVFPPRRLQLDAWRAGRIEGADLDRALRELPASRAAGLRAEDCVAALSSPPGIAPLPLLIDTLDRDPRRHARLSWREALTHQVSQTCAAYFDVQQADWQPRRTEGLYAFWRDTLLHDHGIGLLMGLPGLGRALGALPATAQEAERWVLQRLALPPSCWADYLEAVLLTVQGWASWCAHLSWQARLQGRQDPTLRELLAIRLAWGVLLLECAADADTRPALAAVRSAWRESDAVLAQAQAQLLIDEVWQLALDIGYQRRLAQRLRSAAAPAPGAPVEVQAAFCIDVRSEPLRRALEAVRPGLQTLGVAGFFGLPIAYTPLATAARRPQLPGLLRPTLEAGDRVQAAATPDAAADAPLQHAIARVRARRLARARQWREAGRWPGAAYAFVEAAGLGHLGQLARWLRPGRHARSSDDHAGLPGRYRPLCRPQLLGLDAAARLELASAVLQAMGLLRDLAPLVLLVGHGSQTANNAQAAALDCGACGGQSGEVNVRSLARLLNDPALRQDLARRGLAIPATTAFVAALHNTTTDEIEAFDVDLLPAPAQARWQGLQPALQQACDQVRRERAPRLGLDPRADHAALLAALRRRANDGAQTRPEWGLAGNAAFIVAPRWRSRGAVLEGRVFLHDYDARHDPDGRLLEQLMTAPMLVTHWINWQYHASTADPDRMGSGNKLLHNVVGGTLGVFEGNGGDLRIGLARQSLHDGAHWVHEPLRLSVVVDAPSEAIDAIIERHALVKQLILHGWLHLWRFASPGFECRREDGWRPVPCAA